jgi:hypothetical protein
MTTYNKVQNNESFDNSFGMPLLYIVSTLVGWRIVAADEDYMVAYNDSATYRIFWLGNDILEEIDCFTLDVIDEQGNTKPNPRAKEYGLELIERQAVLWRDGN